MKKINIILIIAILFFFGQLSFGQTANVTKGCSPLEVQFTGPDQTAFYWEFVEGNASSTLQNPVHIFTNPGTYLVVLYEGQGNTKTGEIEIKVYEDPKITILADTLLGCSPLVVHFTSSIELDPDLTIQNYKWAFGDGSESKESNPTHVYTVGGTFSVSLEISTNLTECDQILTLDDYISTNLLDVKFRANKYSFCDIPATVKFTNNTLYFPTNTYEWDFGNGQVSTVFQPDSITYTEYGNYPVTLTVTSPEGCIVTIERLITVGKPVFDISPPQVACLNQELFFNNQTLANDFEWSFGSGATPDTSLDKEPEIKYYTAGLKTITLRALKDPDCYSDTTFTVLIENPDADFNVDPLISCLDPVTINVEAYNKTYPSYDWNVAYPGISVPSMPVASFIYDDKNRDSLYWFKSDTIYITLKVVSENGCTGKKRHLYVESKPNAHFVPSVAQGCAPLNVVFTDHSHSRENIVKWTYFYGTGDSKVFSSSSANSYEYKDPGEYYVKMIIENEAGCVDTSAGVWIKVGEPVVPEFELDKTEICLGDSITVTFNNNDPRIDAYHLYTDDGRFNQCWTEKGASHIFNTLPGEYSITAETEYNGCYSSVNSPGKILVKGAKADIGYMIDCVNPYDLMLESESIQATRLNWTIGTTLVQDSITFVHSFATTGDYTVSLEAFDDISGCPSTVDTKTIFIRDVVADFSIPDKVCDNRIYTVDASMSVDVDNDCSKGYLWYLPTRRPWESRYDTIRTFFPSGPNRITLVVEDINGCRDTLSKEIQSYGIDPYFTVDKDEFCLPASLQINNSTVSDTNIVRWNWQDGSIDKDPVFNISTLYPDDRYLITLIAEDQLGCLDTFSQKLSIYKPISKLYLFPGENFCVGDELQFFADDFTEKGSHLNFLWDLGSAGQFTDRINSLILNKRGTFPVKLYFEEESSGCRDSLFSEFYVVEEPVADFITNVENIDPLCYPKIVNLYNTSVFDSLGYVTWLVDGVSFANEHAQSQTIELPKGDHDIRLAAISVFGCTDTLTRTFTLVGPEGNVETDKSVICLGDTINFTLTDLVDVNDFEWDFGDGNTLANVNPVQHVFDRDVELFDAKIILKSQENGCDHIIEIPLSIFEVSADFDVLEDVTFCPGHVYLENLSEGADEFVWDVLPGVIETEGDTVKIIYPGEGQYTINLKATNSTNNCVDEISKTAEVVELTDFVVIPNLFTPNGDGENDVFRPVITKDQYELEVILTTFKVYNRWGNLVYDNKDPNLGWNGMYDQTDAPAGVYGYVMEAEINGCQKIRSQGNVTLVR